MSYTPGDNYIWPSGDRIQLWIADGGDNWAECGWNEGEPQPNPGGIAVLIGGERSTWWCPAPSRRRILS